MEKPNLLISRDEIAAKVAELAERLKTDYVGRNPVLIGALKGSFVFMADLVRAIGMDCEVDFISVSSYGEGKDTSGVIELVQDLKTAIDGRDVIVVEDIVDTGLSLDFILSWLREKGPASVRVCALLDKPSRRRVEVPIDYVGFTVPDKFVVGYGLDFDERYRYLPDVCALEVD